ncbi:MAG: transposase [Planctomycetota bacterium]
MRLWIEWFRCVHKLRSACSRHVTFSWMVLVLAAMAIRPDLLGVTSFVRGSFLDPLYYRLLLSHFHSSAVSLPLLLEAWVKLAMRLFQPITAGGYVVFAADGLKVPKEGKKMPAVKSLHQESGDNSKAEFIMGHSFQVVSLLAESPTGQVFAVPLISRICEGLTWRYKEKRITLLDKLTELFLKVVRIAKVPAILVADAYYASQKVIKPLLTEGHHLITRARINSVAYRPAMKPIKRKRGRPKKYGAKVKLRNLFKAWRTFSQAISPVYGEQGVTIKYREVDLLWRPVGRIVRFVLVKHPTRGKIILMSTCLELDALAIIKLYGLRFKIEVSFKQAIHTLGTYSYHFWMMPMKPIKRCSGNQNLVGKSEQYRRAVKRKVDAYHRYVQLGCIAQGLLQHLAINLRDVVWVKFRSWLRTMNENMVPSEMVVASALRSSFPEFLLDRTTEPELKKFILDHAECDKIPGIKMAA